MKKLKVALLSKDMDYGQRLMNYVNSNRNNKAWMISFRDREEFYEFTEGNYYDVLLTDYQVEVPEDKQICLLEENSDAGIYKYSNAKDIVDNIMGIMIRRGYNTYTEEVEVSCVYSPIGRSGKTTLCKRLCREKTTDKTLYVGLEEYGENLANGNMKHIIYYIKQRKDAIGELIAEYVEGGTVEELGSPPLYFDLQELNYEDYRWFIEKLKGLKRYGYIVFDMSNSALTDYHILSLFDKVYVPMIPEDASYKKVEIFYRILSKVNLSQIRERIEEIYVFEKRE